MFSLSQVFPITENGIVIHKWIHVYQDVVFGGPVVTYWGYHLERSVGRMSRSLTDRNRSALNLVSNYMLVMASRNVSDEVHRPNEDSVVPRIYAGSGIFTWVDVCDLGMQLAIGKKLNEDACEYVIVPDVLNPLRPFDREE
jgi:hypothetical protein